MNIDFDNFDIPNIESWKAQVQRETNKEKAIIYENKIEKIRVDLYNKDSNYDFQTNAESLKDMPIPEFTTFTKFRSTVDLSPMEIPLSAQFASSDLLIL